MVAYSTRSPGPVWAELRGLGEEAKAAVSSSAYWTSQSLWPEFWRQERRKCVRSEAAKKNESVKKIESWREKEKVGESKWKADRWENWWLKVEWSWGHFECVSSSARLEDKEKCVRMGGKENVKGENYYDEPAMESLNRKSQQWGSYYILNLKLEMEKNLIFVYYAHTIILLFFHIYP